MNGGSWLRAMAPSRAVQHGQRQLVDGLAAALGQVVDGKVRRPHPAELHGGLRPRLDREPEGRASRAHLAEIGVWAGRTLALPVAEAGLDLGFHGDDVDVAHHHQRGALGTVVVVVDVGQQTDLGVLDDRHETDRPPLRRPLPIHGEADLRLGDPIGGAVAEPLLREDHTAFLVHRALVEGEVAGDLAHQHQRGVERGVVGLGQVELVGGVVEAGAGVGVGAERQAEAFEGLNHLAPARHVLGTVEGHVLEEVCEALLVVVLHQRADIEAQPHRRLTGRRGVFQNRIAHPVGQGAEADVGVGFEVGARLRPLSRLQRRCGRVGGEGGRGEGECGQRSERRAR